MKLKVVACGVFEPELTLLADQVPNEIDLVFLDAGLHNVPNTLRERAQEQIDETVGQGYDAIILGYGLCGRGTSGLLARDIPVIIPRVHDCLTLFLGSREEYRRQFSEHPGTFYTTPGWYEKKSLGATENREGFKREELQRDARFPELSEKYGDANAEFIIHFFDSWKRNYTRAAFIDTGVGDQARYADHARNMAQDFDWEYAQIAGSVTILRDLLEGEWDPEKSLILQPGQRSTVTGDDRIFAAIDVADSSESVPACGPPEPHPQSSGSTGCQPAEEPISTPSRPSAPAAPETVDAVGLGIDAGGTYTDCVVYDLKATALLSKSKALTTRHDLLVGINEALDNIDITDPSQVKMVALSTTLATNSIVEGKGGRPGAIIMAGSIGPSAQIDWPSQRLVKGAMAITGIETEAPDPVEVAEAVDELLAEGVDAFAISGYASVTNPTHEQMVKQIVRERCDLPIVCGHELSSRLNYVNRANTAILNSRLLPVIRELVDAVEGSLRARGVEATLMVVKGDGSLISRDVALERPIETVLSGPAASVAGAKHLTGLQDAIILDMGGTTTDTAIVEDGLVRVSPEGARVGGWCTSVEAADISTIGLGGDSRLGFTVDRALIVGPRRVVPLAYLCHQHPSTRETLLRIDSRAIVERSNADALDFFILARPDFPGPLEGREREVIAALANAPLSRNQLARKLKLVSPILLRCDRLEELGVIQRSSLTPTDVLHVTGEFSAWDVEAAAHALAVFSDIFGRPAEEMIERIRQAVVERLAGQVIEKEIPDACGLDPDAWSALLHTVFRPKGEKLRAELHYDRPVIAIGAPVEPFFTRVGGYLGAEVVIPEHADVANAIGAIASEVVVRERAVVRPGEIANYVVHTRDDRAEYEDLRSAVESAKQRTAVIARERALRAGTQASEVKHLVNERRAFTAEGDEMLVEVVIEATVSGKPVIEAL